MVFLVVYKVAKKSIEVSFLWAAAVLLFLRFTLWKGMNGWITPIYKAAGVETFQSQQDVANQMMDIILNSSHIPITNEQRKRLKNIKEKFGI